MILPRVGAIALFALAILLATQAAPSPAPLHGAAWTDPGPEGHSRLAEALGRVAPVRVVEASLGSLPAPARPGDVLFLFPNYRDPLPEEEAALRAFSASGGTIVFAIDGPRSNAWLRAFGLVPQGFPAKLAPGDSDACIGVEIELGGVGYPLCLPSPTAFSRRPEPSGAAVQLEWVANSTRPIVLDVDGDGNLSSADQGPDRFAMAVAWRFQGALLLAVPDGDLWRNGVLGAHPEHLDLARALAGEGRVFLDASATTGVGARVLTDPVYRALAGGIARAALPLLLFVLALAALALRAPQLSPWTPHSPDPDAEDPAREAEIRRKFQSQPTPPQDGTVKPQ